MKIITCEQVSNGHPDKICDQIADAIVTDVLKHDKNGRIAVEVLIKNHDITIAGELTSPYHPYLENIVNIVFEHIGWDKLDYDRNLIRIRDLISQQSPDIALGVDSGGAGDQGMIYGYATVETAEMLPIPYAVATHFLELLRDCGNKSFKADAKAQVSFDYDIGRITTFLCSVQHDPDVSVDDIRPVVEELMIQAAKDYALNTDFKKLVNPTGRFVIGGSFADCGVTGRKLACDTYGSVGRIACGAMSGKDPTKVDRSGAYITRKIARDIVLEKFADKCEVQIAYAIGVAEPVSVDIDTFGTEHVDREVIEKYIHDNYDLTPKGIIDRLDLLNVDYNAVSAYGHFGKDGLPWEK